MLRKRVLSALVILLPVVAATWWGGWWFFALLAIAALLGAWEFYRMLAPSDKAQRLSYVLLEYCFVFILVGLYIMLLLFLSRPQLVSVILSFPMIIIVVVSALLTWLIPHPPWVPSELASTLRRWALTMYGIIFMGLSFGCFLLLREMESGREWVFLTLFAVFASDSAAFLFGRACGRHHLAPTISPQKTWEGATAGFLAALAVSLFFVQLFRLPLGYGEALLLGSLISIAAQGGDLAESWLKRKRGVKDSGKLIPGHGGVLDRLDSLIFTGIVVYYYVLWTT